MSEFSQLGEGICETHVTWEDIEENLRNILNLPSEFEFGANKEVKTLPDGVGFSSRVSVANLDLTKNGHLPQQVIFKISTMQSMMTLRAKWREANPGGYNKEEEAVRLRKFEELIRSMHNAEVEFYSVLENIDDYSQKYNVPHFYCSQAFTQENYIKGFLVMHFYEGVRPVQIHENLTLNELDQVLRSLAKLNALSVNYPDQVNSQTFANNNATMLYQEIITEKVLLGYLNFLQKLTGASLTAQIEGVRENISKAYRPTVFSELCAKFDMSPVFVHGDMWTGNTLWKIEEIGKKSLKQIIDFQANHMGSPAEDLARLLASALSPEDRRNNYESAIGKYYEHLVEATEGSTIPFTLEKLIAAYKECLPTAALILLPIFITKLGSLAKENSDRNAEMTKTMIDKLGALLEDVVLYTEDIA